MKSLHTSLFLFFMVFGAVALLAIAGSSAARANEQKLIGEFGDWQAFAFEEKGGKVCYMASQPKSAKGKYSSRGDVFALLTHRPAEGTRNVFSYIAGYSYKPGSDATVKIDGRNFALFTQDDTGWAPDAETDNQIASALRSGSKMVVSGTSSRGTATTDTFGLKGSSAAYDAISKECGM